LEGFLATHGYGGKNRLRKSASILPNGHAEQWVGVSHQPDNVDNVTLKYLIVDKRGNKYQMISNLE
jgi:hypothetical protein